MSLQNPLSLFLHEDDDGDDDGDLDDHNHGDVDGTDNDFVDICGLKIHSFYLIKMVMAMVLVMVMVMVMVVAMVMVMVTVRGCCHFHQIALLEMIRYFSFPILLQFIEAPPLQVEQPLLPQKFECERWVGQGEETISVEAQL